MGQKKPVWDLVDSEVVSIRIIAAMALPIWGLEGYAFWRYLIKVDNQPGHLTGWYQQKSNLRL